MLASVCTGNGFVVTARAKTPRMTTEKESETLSLRLSKADKAMLDELVEAKRQELAPLGATTSLAQYVRGWIRSTHAAMVAKRQAAPAPTPPATVPAAAPAATPPATVPAAAPAPTPPARTTPAPSPSKVAAPTEAQVRRKLQASKLTQADLSRLTGIDPGMLSRFKSGKKPLSPEKLARLAVALSG